MSDDLDARLASIASDARASVVVGPAEIERALADVRSGVVVERVGEPATRRRRTTMWVAVAAGFVLSLGGGIWPADRGDEQLAILTPVSTPETPGSTAQTLVTTAETSPPATTAATAPPATTTVTIPEPATTVPQPPSPPPPPVVADPFAGLRRAATGIERVCGDAGCTQLVADLDGVVHSCDPDTATVTRHADPPTSVTLVVCPFAIGPGEVAYAFESDDTGANYIAARSLLSGDELQRVSFEGSDADLVPTPAGLAAVGLVLPSVPQPNLTRPPTVPWVLPDPGDAPEFPVGVFEPGASPAISVGERRWVIAEPVAASVGAISGIVVTDDGGFLALVYPRPPVAEEVYLLRGRPDGTIADIRIDDPAAVPALLERSGTIILPAGDTFVRVDPLEAFDPDDTSSGT